jgi:hypothetical protein
MVVHLAAPAPPLDQIPGTRLVGVDGGGLRQPLSFVPAEITAARVLELVGEHAQVRDLTLEEPDIDDVIRRLYLPPALPPGGDRGGTHLTGGRNSAATSSYTSTGSGRADSSPRVRRR